MKEVVGEIAHSPFSFELKGGKNKWQKEWLFLRIWLMVKLLLTSQ